MTNRDQFTSLMSMIDDVKRVNCITVPMFISNLRRFVEEVDRTSTGYVFDHILTAIHRDSLALARYIVTRGVDTLRGDDSYITALREIALASLDRLLSMIGPAERTATRSA